MLDRVFDKEFNMHRVEEFSGLLESRLQAKRNIVIENFRKAEKGPPDEQVRAAEAASLEELCEVYLFYETATPVVNRVNRRLVEQSMPSSFYAMYHLVARISWAERLGLGSVEDHSPFGDRDFAGRWSRLLPSEASTVGKSG